jgi:hypothetical protein
MPIDWLIFAGVYLLWRKGKGKRQKYHIQMLVHWLLFPGISYCVERECFFLRLTMIQKRKNIKTLGNLLNPGGGGGYAPSYKSDRIVFRCSFYFLNCTHWVKKDNLLIEIKFNQIIRKFIQKEWIRWFMFNERMTTTIVTWLRTSEYTEHNTVEKRSCSCLSNMINAI